MADDDLQRSWREKYEQSKLRDDVDFDTLSSMDLEALYGPEGEPIAIVPHDQGPAGVVGELDRWVR